MGKQVQVTLNASPDCHKINPLVPLCLSILASLPQVNPQRPGMLHADTSYLGPRPSVLKSLLSLEGQDP